MITRSDVICGGGGGEKKTQKKNLWGYTKSMVD